MGPRNKNLFLTIIILLCSSVTIYAAKNYDFSGWSGNHTVTGEKAFDYFGHAIAAGDINGDGLEDLVVGAYYADPQDRSGGGCVYIFFGKTLPSQKVSIDLSLDQADVTFFGPSNNAQLGKAVAVGNLNNDNYDDIIISAPAHSEDDVQARGVVFVIYGKASLSGNKDLADSGFDIKILGNNHEDQLGSTLCCTDLNNDNNDEIIIGAPFADQLPKVNCGTVSIIWGDNQLAGQVILTAENVDLIIVGEETNDKLGYSISAGNFNGDDFNDLILGAPTATIDAEQKANAGKIYLFSGNNSFTLSNIDLGTSNHVMSRMYGGQASANIGKVTAAGDVNGDGYDDILFTDFAAENKDGAIGAVYGNVMLSSEIDFRFTPYDKKIIESKFEGSLGEALHVADFNGDNYSDVVIGIPGADTENGDASGLAYVFYGAQFWNDIVDLNSHYNEIYFGATPSDNFGNALCVLRFNEDSQQDLCIGAVAGGNNAGQIYTIMGGLPYLQNQSPVHRANRVEVDAKVRFDLFDDIEGIDINSVQVIVGGITYNSTKDNFSYSGVGSKYSIEITPVEEFGYAQIIDITVNCADLSGWEMPTESYYFRTKDDTDPPYTAKWNPSPGISDVAVDTDITFHIYDKGEGIDISSVNVNINGEDFFLGSPQFQFSGIPDDYYIQINPSENFSFGETVNVAIDGADNAAVANVMSTFRYSFTCLIDSIPPHVINWSPSGGDSISQKAILEFEIIDEGAGVNEDSLAFYLDNQNVMPFSEISENNLGNGFIVQYSPQTPQDYYSFGAHELRIVASDMADSPNHIDTMTTVFCMTDNVPPLTRNHFPEKSETGAATNTIFAVDILDNLMGVDINSVQIKLNQKNIMSSPNTTVTEVDSGYHIKYVPENRLAGQINVSIDASDYNDPANMMPTEYYSFTTVVDTNKPYLGGLDPDRNETDVAKDKNIFLSVYDALTGVDKSSIAINVNDEDVTDRTTIEPVTSGYSVFYDPAEPFQFNETVKVNVSCQDFAINPNQLNTTYYFYIIPDKEPPYVQNMNPTANQVGVALNPEIYLEIVDDGYGVDSASVVMYVNSELVRPEMSAVESGKGYSLAYDPPENFHFSEIVNIAVYASDLADPCNTMSGVSYSFRCIDEDTNPPFLTELEPAAETDVSVNTYISFKLLDAEFGIDSSSIVFKVNNSQISDYYFETVSDPAGEGYYIEYIPPEPFIFSESVNLYIYAQDQSSNRNELPPSQRYHNFICELDTIPPYVVRLNPGFGDNAYANTVIYGEFCDNESGIDTNNVTLKVNHKRVVNYVDSLADSTYIIKYMHSDPYLHGPIRVDFSVKDYAHNSVDTTLICYVVPDTFPPYFVPQNPQTFAQGVKAGSELVVDILDKGMGLDQSSIQFFVNNHPEFNYNLEYNPYHYHTDSLGYRLTYTLPEQLYQGQYVQIRIKANDITSMLVLNYLDSTYVFTIELPEQEIVAIPPIIHPNFGNTNTESRIWIDTNQNTSDISAKIYNIRGKLINELIVTDEDAKKLAIWDGRDKNGIVMTSGIYIYQIKIHGQVHQGSITIAR